MHPVFLPKPLGQHDSSVLANFNRQVLSPTNNHVSGKYMLYCQQLQFMTKKSEKNRCEKKGHQKIIEVSINA